jgi:hypothetical protein
MADVSLTNSIIFTIRRQHRQSFLPHKSAPIVFGYRLRQTIVHDGNCERTDNVDGTDNDESRIQA